MAKPKKNKSKQRRNHDRADARSTDTQATMPMPLFAAGCAALAVAVFAAGMLVWEHFMGGSLPGCGPGSACAKATGSAWGTVPLLNWPISFVGLAYYLGLAVAWLAARRSGMGPLPWIVRLGAALSLMYIIVMLAGSMLCAYCLTSHIANFAFLVVVELARMSSSSAAAAPAGEARPLARLAVTFASATVVLIGWQVQHSMRADARAEQEFQTSTQAMTNNESPLPDGRIFTGRYLLGPERAPIRIVMFTDYQCPDCQRIGREAVGLVESRSDVSLSVKHFPMSTDCNEHMNTNMHPNACWAARAVETAGILGGQGRYWEMHNWLSSRRGRFTDAELHQWVRRMGFDVNQFLAAMMGDQTLRLVQEDVEEALGLGLHYTPMVFINGVELRGWAGRANALTNAVERVAQTNPEPLLADALPISAFEKYIEDWRENPRQGLGPTTSARSLGPDDAAVTIDVWGDYRQDSVAEIDRLLRQIVAERSDVRYTYRLFPIDPQCNDHAPRLMNEHACRANQAAEAAATLFGQEGFWAMHQWLLEHEGQYSDAQLLHAATTLGLDGDALLAEMSSAAVAAAIRRDTSVAGRLRIGNVPFVFVNSKRLPRWKLEGHDVLRAVIDEAAAGG